MLVIDRLLNNDKAEVIHNIMLTKKQFLMVSLIKSITFALIHIRGGGGLDWPLPRKRGFFMAISSLHIRRLPRCT